MKQLITSLSLLITVFSANFDSKAAIVTAIVDGGAWNTAGSWDSGVVPSCGDTIKIPAGYDVKVTANVNLNSVGDPLCGLVRINIAGRLLFSAGVKIRLALGACVNVEDGGQLAPSAKGGGASESIEIDHVKYWQASDGVYTGAGTMGSCGTALPVVINDLSAVLDGRVVTISWSSASEVNIYAYEIQLSKDGVNWDKFAEVSSIGNHSNSYNYFVQEAYEKNSEYTYFKLFSVDMDGEKVRIGSTFLNVTEEVSETELVLYPNPVSQQDQTKVLFETKKDTRVEFQVFNQFGQLVKSEVFDVERGQNQFMIDASEFKSGSYFITITSEEKTIKNKLVVL